MGDRVTQIEQITSKIQEHVTKLMNADEYKNYLSVMAKFNNRSINNCILIAMQKPSATYCEGYKSWENKFNRHVVKGAKGIKVIQPAPFKKAEMVTLRDSNGNTVLNNKGEPVQEKVERVIPAYKVAYVFDISDTEGEPLPEICHKLDVNVDGYEKMLEGLKAISPAPITLEEINSGANGYFHTEDKTIHIKVGMGELQTIKTAIHELAHALMHDKDNGTDRETNRREREVEAESVAYTVSSYYGLDTSDYSFGYIAGWSQGKELKELTERLEVIRATSHEIISKLDNHFMNQELNEKAEITYKNGAGYMSIYKEADGYGCTIYDANMIHIKEGHIDNPNMKLTDATSHFCELMKQNKDSLVPCNQETIKPKLIEADAKFLKMRLEEKSNLTTSHRTIHI